MDDCYRKNVKTDDRGCSKSTRGSEVTMRTNL